MRFRDADESVVAICWVGICRVDDPAAETASGNRSEAMQRSLVVCIEEVTNIGRNIGNQWIFQVLLWRLLSKGAWLPRQNIRGLTSCI